MIRLSTINVESAHYAVGFESLRGVAKGPQTPVCDLADALYSQDVRNGQ